ncbi:ATP-dependent DNA helicase pif1 [Eumeta japonica]|uniref:ATP-dependent DNA helicase n=1 Tax=Eumeta variegata TaxID=151549 RepID=A0A4C1UT95_EUMVA|nr:ATP-dependent DNA helicase pif1 [Eumeta japonica]
MYSVEWQKRGLPHAHILIWLLNKLHSNEVDDIISAEIPDPVTDPRLHDIVTTQMVHGPCGALNPLSPCMADGKCTKRYPRPSAFGKWPKSEANAAQRAERPPSTTLTSFFAMCEADPFAATLMYVEMPKYYTWNQSTKKFQRRKQGTPVPDWPAVDNNTGGLFFLDAPGGTGKTFVISLILATIRSRCDIALALASSGIAATLLDGGRTAHSALKLPLNLNTIDTPTCNISRSNAMGKLLMQCKLIVWDEVHIKKSLEALNFTLKDLRRNNNIFGGLMILLAGDFETLPVVPVERLQMN